MIRTHCVKCHARLPGTKKHHSIFGNWCEDCNAKAGPKSTHRLTKAEREEKERDRRDKERVYQAELDAFYLQLYGKTEEQILMEARQFLTEYKNAHYMVE
jgi:hypothetical protein